MYCIMYITRDIMCYRFCVNILSVMVMNNIVLLYHTDIIVLLCFWHIITHASNINNTLPRMCGKPPGPVTAATTYMPIYELCCKAQPL